MKTIFTHSVNPSVNRGRPWNLLCRWATWVAVVVDPAYAPFLFRVPVRVLFRVVDGTRHWLWDLVSWNALGDADCDDASRKDSTANWCLVPKVRWVMLKRLAWRWLLVDRETLL